MMLVKPPAAQGLQRLAGRRHIGHRPPVRAWCVVANGAPTSWRCSQGLSRVLRRAAQRFLESHCAQIRVALQCDRVDQAELEPIGLPRQGAGVWVAICAQPIRPVRTAQSGQTMRSNFPACRSPESAGMAWSHTSRTHSSRRALAAARCGIACNRRTTGMHQWAWSRSSGSRTPGRSVPTRAPRRSLRAPRQS